MEFWADFHVHSRYSRATAKDLDLAQLYLAAQQKGITVVGTGDATHPVWMEAIRENLSPAEEGLFRLREDLAADLDRRVPAACRAPVRFILTAEISNIYKKDGQTRKNHNLVFLPDLETAERFSRTLAGIGNIVSDGRPILGLDARHLLEIVLASHPRAFLVPAHIWTPWFSLLGSKSGFDSLEDCFGDLAPEVFAVETGLSSDPAMNRRVSRLDRLTLISNSDAHSPSKLGREANRFATELSFEALRQALRRGGPPAFLGTVEFFPEEGKYHLDGHRKCAVRLSPEESRAAANRCPACGQPLTLGVLHRVEELADRTPAEAARHLPPFQCLVPLPEIIGEVLDVGPGSRKVGRVLEMLLATFGSERAILQERDPEELDAAGIPLLAEAIRRMRDNRVQLEAGYDGQYGRIRLFDDGERRVLLGQRLFFPAPPPPAPAGRAVLPADRSVPADSREPLAAGPPRGCAPSAVFHRNAEQRRAIEHHGGPLLIVAGPGTGKTSTLTRRMAWLIEAAGVPASRILGITFTEKAAAEMSQRLEGLLDGGAARPWCATFHAFAWQLLAETPGGDRRLVDEEERRFLLGLAVRRLRSAGLEGGGDAAWLGRRIEAAKQRLEDHRSFFEPAAADSSMSFMARGFAEYQRLLESMRAFDFEDLIARLVMRLEQDAAFALTVRGRWSHVCVDEFQDVNHAQYRLVRLLCPDGAGLSVIGDPDQAIYGFRGSDSAYFRRFARDYPNTTVVRLTRNYRSAEAILDASWQVIRKQGPTAGGFEGSARLEASRQGVPHVAVLELPTEATEAAAVSREIEQLVGGSGFWALDAGQVDGHGGQREHSFADFAVLFRTAAQADALERVLGEAGIPFQHASRERLLLGRGVAEILAVYRLLHGWGGLGDLIRAAAVVPPALKGPTLDAVCAWLSERGWDPATGLAQAARLPIPGLGARRQRRVVEWAATLTGWQRDLRDRPLGAALSLIGERTGVAASMGGAPGFREALEALARRGEEAGPDAAGFCRRLALTRDVDLYRPEVEKVALMTMHAAKGLEFPVVFVVGCEDGWVPLRRPGSGPTDDEEERRLFYVAMTRARERLYLTWARRRRIHGRVEARTVSPFVEDIERRLRRHLDPPVAGPRGPQASQLKLF